MSITPKEKEVFSLTRTQANKSAEEIARHSGLKATTVRRAVDRLFDKGVYRRRSIIADVSRIGYTIYRIFFSLTGTNDQTMRKLKSFIVNHEQVSMFSELGGEYQFDVEFLSGSPADLSAFIHRLSDFSGTLRIYSLGVTTSFTLFGNSDWMSTPSSAPSISYTASKATVTLDDVDGSILKALSQERFRNLQELSRILKLPLTTLKYRIQKLEKDKVIVGHYYVYDTNKANLLPFTILIEARALDTKFRKKLTAFCQSKGIANTLESMIANYSFCMNVAFKAYEEAAELSNTLYSKFDQEIVSIKILPQFRFHKYAAYPFA